MNKYELNLKSAKWIDIVGPKKSYLNHLSPELDIPNRILINALDYEYLPKYDDITSAAVIYLRTIDPSGKPDAHNIQDLTTKITLIIKDN